ncbi:hypothetical protein KU70_04590 [Campylobacter fetus]|nr:hypothetical protein KU70_04590 [Campylobacter fetus]
MAIMSLNTNPQPDIGSGGHVVDSTIQTKDIVVLKTEDSANLKIVANNIDTIDRVAGSLLPIKNVSNELQSVKAVLAIDDKLDSVLAMGSSIKRLIPISDKLNLLANSIDGVVKAAENSDTLIELGKSVEELRFLYEIREHIVSVNSVKDKLLEIVDTMSSLKEVEANLEDINLVALHMLAVEVVAQNLELLGFFNNHTELFEKTVEMYPALQEFLKYVNIAQELVDIVTNLPKTLEQFKEDMNNLANEMTEKFKALADDRLEQMERAYDKFMSESLRLRESILDVDKALTDFKLKSMEEYTVLREGIARFKEDLAKSQEQIEGDINEVEKRTTKKISYVELNLSNAIETVKKDNAEFKLEIVKQLKDQENKDRTSFKELEKSLNSKISTNNSFKNTIEEFKNNTTNTLTTVQEDIRQLKAKPTAVVQESTWEVI